MLSNKRLVAVCSVILFCNIAILALFVKYNAKEKCYVTITKDQNVTIIIPDDFLSIGIDSSEVEDFDKVDFMNKQFMELASALAPARLRLGGTMSDRLIFSAESDLSLSCEYCPNTNKSEHVCPALKKICKHKFLPFFLLTGQKWKEINAFCKETNIKLLFTLNLLLRDHHLWDERNAHDLISFSKQHNFDVDWQLGNEPNSFPHVYNTSVSPKMLARDFKNLRRLLNDIGYGESLLVGPDTTRPQPHRPECLRYMVEFLGNGSKYINVRSWHQYYLNSRTANLKDFWNPNTFNLLEEQILTMKNHTTNYSDIPMWLSETSSSYGGGADGLSNSYAGTPLWLDKLGLSAKHNITTVIRQSFFGGNYSLIDRQYEPLPDWWVSVLYKRLVGGKVLQIHCECSELQRMYAHCTNRKYTNDTTAITIYAINLEMAKAKFLLNGTAFPEDDITIDEFIISAPSNNRKTKIVLLNGWQLHYESSLPDLQPRRLRFGNHISMPPYSIGFWVVQKTSISICN